MIKFTLDHATEVETMLQEEPERIIIAALVAIDEGVQRMVERVRENVSGGVLQRRTGTLEDSVQPQAPRITGLTVSEDIQAAGNWAYYGRIQEFGVEHGWMEENQLVGHPMPIDVGGETIFRTIVEHPALPARPWFYPVLEEESPQIVEEVKAKINEELET